MSRETWSNKYGFIAACLGSAIGMGNIWMFPYKLGKFGGAAFLIPYLICALVLGATGLMGEFALGRSQKKGPIGAYEGAWKIRNNRLGPYAGAIALIAQAGILVFYAVVVGWVLRYVYLAFLGFSSIPDIPAAFGSFKGTSQTLIWSGLSLLLTLVIVKAGLVKGIEKMNKIMIPALFVIFIVLLFRSLTLPGAMEGVKYLLVPQWHFLFEGATWLNAMGQAFFSVSLGGAGMVVYGSYLKEDADIPDAAIKTAFFDTMAALLAGFVIIPAAFAFGVSPNAGPPLLFITIPSIFVKMPGGYIAGILFFLAVLFAGITTLLALMEIVVEACMDRLNWGRSKSSIFTMVVAFAAGIPLALSMENFGKFAGVVSNYLVPIGAVLGAATIFWIYGFDRAVAEIDKGAKIPMPWVYRVVARYVVVPVALAILVFTIPH